MINKNLKERVCAVVVTYNRLPYLERLLLCLEAQTFPVCEVIIVDNGSKDGTREWLKGKSYTVLYQDNVGSAGGFYTGISEAMKQTCDYIWIMDDDGHPSTDCLEKLMNSKAKKTYAEDVVLCSVILNEHNCNELSFPIPDLSSRYVKFLDHYTVQTDKLGDIKNFEDPNGYPWGFFFNSILLHRSVVTKAGLPKKELFIWGDEVEYFNRIRKCEIKVYTVPESIFYHPKLSSGNMAKWKEKYAVRNYVYIHRLYKPFPFLHHLKAFFKIFAERKFYLLKPFYHGLIGDFCHKYHS